MTIFKLSAVATLVMFLVLGGCQPKVNPVEPPGSAGTLAKAALPAGANITKAELWLYKYYDQGTSGDVKAYRITGDWTEGGVTWNNFLFPTAKYDVITEWGTSPVVSPDRWFSINITDLVKYWLLNPAMNYGVLLKQTSAFSVYWSSEYTDIPSRRPKLEITYTLGGGTPNTVVVQRPALGVGEVFDDYISQCHPNSNMYTIDATHSRLYTGIIGTCLKYSLFRFDLTSTCTGSIGDFVWWEKNNNTSYQVGIDEPLKDVVIELKDANGNLLKTTTTDANGAYLFNGLCPGTYKVCYTTPAGYMELSACTNATDGSTNNSNHCNCIVVVLDGTPNNPNIDFGFKKPCIEGIIGGIDLRGLADKYLFFFANGSNDANWQGATKGFVGDVLVDGIQAKERTSGGVPYAGTIFTNDGTLGAWQNIVDQNAGQAFRSFGNGGLVTGAETKLAQAFQAINILPVSAGYANRSSTSLNGVNTQNGHADIIVINVTSGFQVSSKINITGDAGDVFILRWDTDSNPANGYQGQVKFQSGGAIVPMGGLTASNFIHVAGDLNASGGGSTPPPPYPQGPRLNNGMGALINGGKDFSGGGFFTGYWLTTGDPRNGETSPFSNAIFVGGWYTLTNKFSMTSGTSGVYVAPKCP